MTRHESARMLLAAMVLSVTLGSVHAFSVLIAPLESSLAIGRGPAGFTYSLALVCLTLLVLAGHRIYDRVPAWAVGGASLVAAAGGVVLVVAGSSAVWLWVGYGVVFGAANGLGYGFALLLAARACPRTRGAAMGAITALYAVGAAGSAAVLAHWLAESGLPGALLRLAAVLVASGAVVAGLLARVRPPAAVRAAPPPREPLAFDALRRFWIAYFCSVLAGLMAIGHAAPILRAAGGSAAAGAVAIAIGNAAGGFVAGALCDRIAHHRLLAGLSTVSAVALGTLALGGPRAQALVALTAVGFAYGAVIAVFPPAVLARAGERGYAKAYGRVFTAWGAAGLLGPWLAGAAQALTGSYELPLAAAAAVAVAGAYACARLAGPAG